MAPTALPSWQDLLARSQQTQTGVKLAAEDADRAAGRGPAHRASTLRLFGARSKDEVRVKLYRDSAAWCPYCQKLWIMLEEKQIPYEVELINMRSYGDKPKSFLAKCPRGLLPAVELDGELYTESLDIMAMLDQGFDGPRHRRMLPARDSADFRKLQKLLQQERQLFGAWCQYVFHPGLVGKRSFDASLQAFETALGESPNTPWLLDFSDGPSLVDLQYVSHVERMLASVPYWKGHAIRDETRFPNIHRWLAAFEQRQAYMATRSDWYTHVKDIPPQYGMGESVKEAATVQAALDGNDAAWFFPLPELSSSSAPSDTLQRHGWEPYERDAHHEAAYRVLCNHEAVSRFMARGAGVPGGWANGRPDRAELADPYAQPAKGQVAADVDAALRAAVLVMLELPGCGSSPSRDHEAMLKDNVSPKTTRQVADCACYLRDRVGVPRDMSYPAARWLRASLNWVAHTLR
eukprot:TRINITY_DN81134_c0_g1_i1.p1 TRINITY_DN81134_c0_g1~~TRINITY_DN81134_c0_g1_i1.p1  ORF type:complete len:463 (-),score=100.19 TRINITY_DN81134_c0_g1_i1:180-1568(-)